MLHAITGNQNLVRRALQNAVKAFEENNPVVRNKIGKMSHFPSRLVRHDFSRVMAAELAIALETARQEELDAYSDFYVSHDRRVGLAQSAMNQAIERNAATTPGPASAPFKQFGPLDPGWIECLVDAYYTSFVGNAPFVQHQQLSDFVFTIPDQCTVVLVADWGADDSAAMQVAAQIRSVRPALCIHLGDIYYAGQRNEADTFLKNWPMSDPATKDIPLGSSFALNGNHEMYSGGRYYFGDVLGAFGQAASYFCLRNSNWQILAFDSAYVEHRLLSPEKAAELDMPDALVASQWPWLVDKLQGNPTQKTIFLSHHQPLSAFQPEHNNAANFRQDVKDLLKEAEVGNVYGWFFGHEHRCTIYDNGKNGYKARLIGHGCIPHAPPPPHYKEPKDCARFTKMNYAANELGDAMSGFAILRFDGPMLSISYVNEDGTPAADENQTPFSDELWT